MRPAGAGRPRLTLPPLLRDHGYDGPLILHGLAEDQVADVRRLPAGRTCRVADGEGATDAVFDATASISTTATRARACRSSSSTGSAATCSRSACSSRVAGLPAARFDARGHGETRPLGDPDEARPRRHSPTTWRPAGPPGDRPPSSAASRMAAAVGLNFARDSRSDARPGPVAAGLARRAVPGEHAGLPADRRPDPRARGEGGARPVPSQTPECRVATRLLAGGAQSLVGPVRRRPGRGRRPPARTHPRGRPCAEPRAVGDPSACRPWSVANKQDPIHPCDFGEAVAAGIPGAEFREIGRRSPSASAATPTRPSPSTDFLRRHFARRG